MATITGQSRRAMFEHEFGYELDGDTIVSSGMFEGEAWFAPIVYEWMMDGDGEIVDEPHDCENGDDCDCEDLPSFTLFEITDTDRAELELDPSVAFITLATSDQGFVYVKEWTAEEYEHFASIA
jgi:hypothetical protein